MEQLLTIYIFKSKNKSDHKHDNYANENIRGKNESVLKVCTQRKQLMAKIQMKAKKKYCTTLMSIRISVK